MADNPDLLSGSRRLMLAALLAKQAQPNVSLGGNIGNALAMGLMGLYEGQDEQAALNLVKGNVGILDQMRPQTSAAPVSAAPPPVAAPAGGGYALPANETSSPDRLNSMDAQVASGPELKVALAERLQQKPAAVDKGIRTVIGEAAGEPPIGQQAVGNVILNRSLNNNTPLDQVVTAPHQFEPWSRPDARARMSVPDTTPQYTDAARAMFAASQADPTGGATHFYSPGVQAGLGRQPPAWDNGKGQTIGTQRFFRNPDQPQVAQAPQQAPQLPANPMIDLWRQKAAAAEASGNRGQVLQAYTKLQEAMVSDYAERRKFELERMGKLNPTYSDLHPDLEMKEAPDGSGNIHVYDKKAGRLVNVIPPPAAPSQGVQLPDGRVVQPPPGLTGEALKAWRTKMAQEAAGAGAGVLTESQSNSQAYANRMEMAEPIIRKYSGAASNLKDAMLSNVPIGQQVAAMGISDDYKRLLAAKRAWISGNLRKESGATIQPSEMADADRTYFPQPGDPPDLVKQKEEMRAVVVDAVRKGAGPGYVGAGQKPGQQAGDPLAMARDAIARGADPAAVRDRLQKMGVDPAGL